jgi:hypothetical protein
MNTIILHHALRVAAVYVPVSFDSCIVALDGHARPLGHHFSGGLAYVQVSDGK